MLHLVPGLYFKVSHKFNYFGLFHLLFTSASCFSLAMNCNFAGDTFSEVYDSSLEKALVNLDYNHDLLQLLGLKCETSYKECSHIISGNMNECLWAGSKT